MKRFIWTFVSTIIVTAAVVYAWDQIVIYHFGWYNYPNWIGYALISLCAYAGGSIGTELSKRVNFNFKKKKYITMSVIR